MAAIVHDRYKSWKEEQLKKINQNPGNVLAPRRASRGVLFAGKLGVKYAAVEESRHELRVSVSDHI